ncbi:hypothetical protein A2U01_0108327, partial [Trifolium medium]|nr:hypothetical protein [Trifolium medium]
MEVRACYLRNIPTSEEIAKALHLDVKDLLPFPEVKNNIEGFSKSALE